MSSFDLIDDVPEIGRSNPAPSRITSSSVVSSSDDDESLERLPRLIFTAPDCDVLCLGGTIVTVSIRTQSGPVCSV